MLYLPPSKDEYYMVETGNFNNLRKKKVQRRISLKKNLIKYLIKIYL